MDDTIRKHMETAIRIQEVFDEMAFFNLIDLSDDNIGPDERIVMFCDWAEEFEQKYADTEEYEEDFYHFCGKYASEKIKERFGESKRQ